MDKSQLGSPTFVDVGEIVGFLKPVEGGGTGDEVAVDVTFFSEPGTVAHLGGVTSRAARIFDLLASLLPTPIADWPPDGSALPPTQWFPINLADSEGKPEPTGVHVVLPADHHTDQPVIGLGLWHEMKATIGSAEINIVVYASFPFLHIDSHGVTVVLGSPGSLGGDASATGAVAAGNPIRLGVRVLGPTGQTPFGSAYSLRGIELDAELFLSGPHPGGFALHLIDTQPPIGDLVSALSDLLSGHVIGYVDAVVGSASVTAGLNKNLLVSIDGAPSLTAGEILAAMGLLAGEGTTAPVVYTTADLHQFLGQDSTTVAERLLHVALDKLCAYTKPIIPIEQGGLYFVKDDGDGTVTSYGVRLAIPDLPVVGKDDQPGVELLLQLGKFFTGQDSPDDGWVTAAGGRASPAGISMFLLDETDDVPSFSPRVEVVSVGVDIKKGADQPLIDVDGYVLGGIEARVFVGKPAAAPIVFGGGARFDGLGIPLGPGFGKASGDNPVAGSLLSSAGGSGEDEGTGGGAKDAVNPTFSLSGSYLRGGSDSFVVALYDEHDVPTKQVTLAVQRAYGPLHVDKIGLGWDRDTQLFELSLTADIVASALEIALVDLSLGIPVTHPADFDEYRLGLKGLGISFDAPPIKVVGAFLEVEKDEGGEHIVEYDGVASLTFADIGLSALGSYAAVTDAEGTYTSLFIFAVLDVPLGGVPPYFFITALAAGFGYNRGLVLPEIHEVAGYPLVAGLEDPTTFFGGGDPSKALVSMGDAVPVERGEYWLALGLKFTSFELIETSAVLSVAFGHRLEIAVVGLSRMALPKSGDTLVLVELGIEIVIAPDEGFFGASAILTDNSFLLDPNCKLTGGFAFFVWYAGSKHPGDFVLTVGGYNTAFPKPAWYPDIPRLGFNWVVGTTVVIKGGSYFALTSTQLMLGGGLEIQFHAGGLRAWFIAQLDILIGWSPFHFYFLVSVSIGVSLTLHILGLTITLKLELGAGLVVWGPPTGGTVRITLFIISFTVGFGASQNAGAKTIGWSDYQATLLPAASSQATQPAPTTARAMVAAAAAGPTGSTTSDSTNTVKIVALGEPPRTETIGGVMFWIVRPDHFSFATQSSMPATVLTASGKDVATGPTVSVRPMGLNGITSLHRLSMAGTVAGTSVTVDLNAHWTHAPTAKSLPAAQFASGLTPDAVDDAKLVDGLLTGFEAIAPSAPVLTGPQDIVIATAFTAAEVNEGDDEHLPLQSPAPVPAGELPIKPPGLQSLATIKGSISTTAVAQRAAVFDALIAFGFDARWNDTMDHVAADPTGTFVAAPYLGAPIVGVAA